MNRPHSRGWYVDGRPVRGKALLDMWYELDFSEAWVDEGPSPAGNPGPYLKVPRVSKEDGERYVHRVYPVGRQQLAIVEAMREGKG